MNHLHLSETDSTMLEAERRIALGATEPLIITAEKQTGGLGRHGRTWESPSGNVYWTALLPIEPAWPRDASLALFSALAVVDTLNASGVPRPAISVKWPNDTLVNGKKISGILIKRATSQSPAWKDGHYIVGIGINVQRSPENVAFPATCLHEEIGSSMTHFAVSAALTGHFRRRLAQWIHEGFPGCLAEYQSLLYRLNEPVKISFDKDRLQGIEGINRGVDRSGALRIELQSGAIKPVNVGEVMFF